MGFQGSLLLLVKTKNNKNSGYTSDLRDIFTDVYGLAVTQYTILLMQMFARSILSWGLNAMQCNIYVEFMSQNLTE